MKYEMLDGRYKVPILTKEWKAMWFVLGMFFQYIAVIYALIFYRLKYRNLPTVAKVATKWSAIGSWLMFGTVLCGYFIFALCH